MKLIDTLFPKAAIVAAANERIKYLEAYRSEQERHIIELTASFKQVEAAQNGLQKELTVTRAKLREQTDADLLLVSARIIMDTLKGEKPKQQELTLQGNLLAQQQALGSTNYNSGFPYGGMLGFLFEAGQGLHPAYSGFPNSSPSA